MIRMYYIHGLCYGTHFLAWFYCCNTKFSRSLGALQVTNAPLQPSLPLCGGGKMPKLLMGIRQPEQAPPCQQQEQGPARTDKANLCWVCSQPAARLPDRPAGFPKCRCCHWLLCSSPPLLLDLLHSPRKGQEAPSVEVTLIKWYPALVSP